MYKILVVDDEPDLRSQLEWAAKGTNREVSVATNETEAIDLISRFDYDVIVTDLRMNGNAEGGLDVLRAAKAKNIYTQVIVITSYGTPEVSVETMMLGAFDYLERTAPGTDTLMMIKYKIALALEFQETKRGKENKQ